MNTNIRAAVYTIAINGEIIFIINENRNYRFVTGLLFLLPGNGNAGDSQQKHQGNYLFHFLIPR
jgi:hypothetical protein